MSALAWTGDDLLRQALYAAAWLSFGAGHSVLAAESVKSRLGVHLGAWYRLTYNVAATLHLLAVVAVGDWMLGAVPGFDRPVWLVWFQHGLAAVGLVGVIVAGRAYDLGRLTGIRQIRAAARGEVLAEDEPLHTGGLHRAVRHPIYSAAFLLLWGRAHDPLGVATALWASLYLVIGAWFEERRLIQRYGEAYRAYRMQVPMFVPWRGRLPAGPTRTDR